MKIKSILLCCVILAVGAVSTFGQAKTSLDYLKAGSVLYINHQYKEAIVPYSKALDLEKKDRKLERTWWIVLVDNLSIAYGITGDLKNSREVIEYGISQDATYPLFYYNMACSYGEENVEENAIKYLRLAYKNKDNMLESESLPDPATDSSFQNLMKSASFRKALAEMKSGK